jgi:hypothetical protein
MFVSDRGCHFVDLLAASLEPEMGQDNRRARLGSPGPTGGALQLPSQGLYGTWQPV